MWSTLFLRRLPPHRPGCPSRRQDTPGPARPATGQARSPWISPTTPIMRLFASLGTAAWGSSSSPTTLRGALFDRILEAATGKPSGEAIASELRPGRGQGAKKTTAAPSEHIVDPVATAPEIGQFFLKHQFDGRQLKRGEKPTATRLVRRRGDSFALVQRSHELLFVVLLNLSDDTPLQLDADLCTCLDCALRSLRAVQPSTVKPQARAH
jgi:hypothetical protein